MFFALCPEMLFHCLSFLRTKGRFPKMTHTCDRVGEGACKFLAYTNRPQFSAINQLRGILRGRAGEIDVGNTAHIQCTINSRGE